MGAVKDRRALCLMQWIGSLLDMTNGVSQHAKAPVTSRQPWVSDMVLTRCLAQGRGVEVENLRIHTRLRDHSATRHRQGDHDQTNANPKK